MSVEWFVISWLALTAIHVVGVESIWFPYWRFLGTDFYCFGDGFHLPDGGERSPRGPDPSEPLFFITRAQGLAKEYGVGGLYLALGAAAVFVDPQYIAGIITLGLIDSVRHVWYLVMLPGANLNRGFPAALYLAFSAISPIVLLGWLPPSLEGSSLLSVAALASAGVIAADWARVAWAARRRRNPTTFQQPLEHPRSADVPLSGISAPYRSEAGRYWGTRRRGVLVLAVVVVAALVVVLTPTGEFLLLVAAWIFSALTGVFTWRS